MLLIDLGLYQSTSPSASMWPSGGTLHCCEVRVKRAHFNWTLGAEDGQRASRVIEGFAHSELSLSGRAAPAIEAQSTNLSRHGVPLRLIGVEATSQ
jgi:hypothetical protein